MDDHQSKRDQRLVNYQKIIDAMEKGSMSIDDMANVIGCKDSTARRYQIALAHHKLIHRVTRNIGKPGQITTYALIASEGDVSEFIEFIASCATIEHEIGQTVRRRGDVGDFGSRIVINSPATNNGVARHFMDTWFFGDGMARGRE